MPRLYPSTLPEAPLGVLLNTLSKGRIFPRTEQRSDFVYPPPGSAQASSPIEKEVKSSGPSTLCDVPATVGDKDISPSETPQRNGTDDTAIDSAEQNREAFEKLGQLEKAEAPAKRIDSSSSDASHRSPHSSRHDPNLVGWYSDVDTDNPQNWSRAQKLLSTAAIFVLTFAVYVGSAIYTPSMPGVMENFDVSERSAALGLSLFIFGYAVGPLILSPLSEIPALGRNGIYIPAIALSFVFNIVGAWAPNWNTLMAARFFSGFTGSPALSTGGASLSDMWSPSVTPYAIATWSMGAVCGPILGPVLAGYAAEANWRWPLYELVIISGGALIILLIILPETSHTSILRRRAIALRRLTGNDKLYSQGEKDAAGMDFREVVTTALVRPFRLALEPALLATNILLGVSYGVFYLFFESFPLVFTDIYGFSLGASGLPFLGIAVAAMITLPIYLCYLKYVVQRRVDRRGGVIDPEERLEAALFASVLQPISLFIFGATSRADVSYFGPIVGSAVLFPGLFLLFQSILTYQPLSYPEVVASVMAANTLFRSAVAGAFPLFGRAYYTKLGVPNGSYILGGITIALIIPLFFVKRYGAQLRARSKYATG